MGGKNGTKNTAPGAAQAVPTINTHVAVICDRSGSMDACLDAAIGAFNENLRAIREGAREGTGWTKVTVVQFDDVVDFLQVDVSPDEVVDRDRSNYVPRGNTALRDAQGLTVERLAALEDADDAHTNFLVVTVTDGLENASKRYTTWEALRDLTGPLEASGRWTFATLVSNIDLDAITDNLGTAVGNVASYTSTAAGYAVAGQSLSVGTRSFFEERTKGALATTEFYGGQRVLGEDPQQVSQTTPDAGKARPKPPRPNVRPQAAHPPSPAAGPRGPRPPVAHPVAVPPSGPATPVTPAEDMDDHWTRRYSRNT